MNGDMGVWVGLDRGLDSLKSTFNTTRHPNAELQWSKQVLKVSPDEVETVFSRKFQEALAHSQGTQLIRLWLRNSMQNGSGEQQLRVWVQKVIGDQLRECDEAIQTNRIVK
jgi:hypothetical protein